MEVGGQVEAILLKGVDIVTYSAPVVNFGQDIGLPYPTVVTGTAVSCELFC